MKERRAGTTPEIEARWTEMLRERGLVPDAAETEYVEGMLRERGLDLYLWYQHLQEELRRSPDAFGQV
jgi:hypothetical protein